MCGEYRDLHLLKDRLKASPQNPTRPGSHFSEANRSSDKKQRPGGMKDKKDSLGWNGISRAPLPPCPPTELGAL